MTDGRAQFDQIFIGIYGVCSLFNIHRLKHGGEFIVKGTGPWVARSLG